MSDKLNRAGGNLAEVFGDPYVASDTGGHFTCGEAESIARALVACGELDAAATWLAGHAEHDDGGDTHFEWGAAEIRRAVEGFAAEE